MLLIDQMRDQFALLLTNGRSIDDAFKSAVITAYEMGMRDGRDQVLLDGIQLDMGAEYRITGSCK